MQRWGRFITSLKIQAWEAILSAVLSRTVLQQVLWFRSFALREASAAMGSVFPMPQKFGVYLVLPTNTPNPLNVFLKNMGAWIC